MEARMEYASDTATVLLLRRAIVLHSALKLGFHLTLQDVTPEEFQTVKLIAAEVERAKQEEIEAENARRSGESTD